MRLLLSILFFVTALTRSCAGSLEIRQDQSCKPQYTVCEPSGATRSALPPVGTALASIYVELLSSVRGVSPVERRSIHGLHSFASRDTTQICCASGTTCLIVKDLNMPFCYDAYTTDFFLADGSTGTLDNGTLNIAGGPEVNLVNGIYSIAGTSGNIYGTSGPLSTATLAIPSPYTSSGVGGPIPISELAGLVTLTTTIPGTTIPPMTLAATTALSAIVVSPTTTVVTSTNAIVGGNTIQTETTVAVGGTTVTTSETEPATTIPGTTIPPETLTFTTAIPSSAGASPGSNEGIPNGVPSLRTGACLMAIALAALIA